MKTETITQ